MDNLNMRELIADPDSWYEAWENTVEQEQTNFLLATIRETLPGDFNDTTDFNGVILDWLGSVYDAERDFETALAFLEEYAQRQPVLYAESSAYFAGYFTDFYYFTGRPDAVRPQYELFLADPCMQVDELMEFHKKLWLWGSYDWAAGLAKNSYGPVLNSPKVFEWVARDLATPALHEAFQKVWEQFIAGGKLDFSYAMEAAKEFEFGVGPEFWDHLAEVFKLAKEGAGAALPEKILLPSEENSYLTIALFQTYMHQKGMHFHTASIIMTSLFEFWMDEADKKKRKDAGPFYRLEKEAFDRYLSSRKKLFSLDIVEVCTTLWGSVFVYDFLLSRQFITAEVYDEAMQTIRELKSVMLSGIRRLLWRAGFIHKNWPRPDSITAEIFNEEAEAFEAGFREKHVPVPEKENPFDFNKATKKFFGAEKKVPSYEKISRPPRNPAKANAGKKHKKKKKKR